MVATLASAALKTVGKASKSVKTLSENSIIPSSQMKLVTGLMKDASWMMKLSRIRIYIVAGVISAILLVIGYFVTKFLFKRRLRIPQLSHTIYLEKHNAEFVDSVATALYITERNRMNPSKYLFTTPTTKNNLLGYERIFGSELITLMNSIKQVSGVKSYDHMSDSDLNKEIAIDEYIDDISAVVNNGFVDSKSPKLGNIGSVVFDSLRKISKKRAEFERFVEDESILNFIDREMMDVPEENRTLRDFGKFANPSVKKQFDVALNGSSSESSTIVALRDLINKRPDFQKTEIPDPKKHIDAMFKVIESVYFDQWEDADKSHFTCYQRHISNQSVPDACSRDFQNAVYDNMPEDLSVAYATLITMYEIYDVIERKNWARLYDDQYVKVETFLKSGPVEFSNVVVQTCMEHYQRALDTVYALTNNVSIQMAVSLTIAYIVDDRKADIKETLLDNIGSSYVTIHDMLVRVERDLDRLIQYNFARNPDKEGARKLYVKKLSRMWQYHIVKMIWEQWYAIMRLKRPPAYQGMLKYVTDNLRAFTVVKLFETIFGKESTNVGNLDCFDNDHPSDIPDHDSIKLSGAQKPPFMEHFFVFDGAGAVQAAAVAVGTALGSSVLATVIANFKKMYCQVTVLFKLLWIIIKMLSNPKNLLIVIVKMLLFFVLCPILIFLQIPIGSMMLAEIPLFMCILTVFTSLNTSTWLAGTLFIIVFGLGIDVHLFSGKLYPIFYRWFAAAENAPDAWRSVGQHHMGNRTQRTFLAWRECGVTYVPDDKTGGTICKRTPESIPNICPQANIYRAFKNLPLSYPYKPINFIPDATFLNSGRSSRNKQISAFKKMKLQFYRYCDASMEPYDNLTKNICRTLDYIDTPSSKKNELRVLCYDTYCHNGRRENFCHRFTPDSLSGMQVGDDVFNRIFFLTCNLIVVAGAIVMLQNKLSQSVAI